MNTANGKNKKHDMETIVICGLMAVMAAVGVTALLGMILGVSIVEVGMGIAAGIIFGLAGVLWGILLLFNLM